MRRRCGRLAGAADYMAPVGLSAALGFAAVVATGILLTGCSSSKVANRADPFAGKASPMYPGSGPLPKGGGRYHIGKPYQVALRTYTPHEDADYDQVGIASWYGPSFHRRMTSNGEWFDQDYMSAAHKTLPLPSYARVTNLENGRTIVVRINDRGPFVGDRIIDLSKRSADTLGFRQKGKAKVRVTYLGPAPLGDDTRQLASMNRGAPVQVASREVPQQQAALNPQPVEQANYTGRTFEPASASASGYFIQVASYSDPDNAGRARSRLAGLGNVTVTPVEADLGTFYRVRVGPLASYEDANAALEQVREAGHYDARVVGVQN
ncbi:MAG: septal ring lytic transglycosylase RlpA family protein [Parvibaculaceae bacterium]